MSVNAMTFEQASSLLNAIHKQATGKEAGAILNTSDFVSVAQKTLRIGVDPVLNAISTIVGRTIFSNRVYKRKFANLYVDSQRYGYITRKLSISDRDWDNDVSFELQDGETYTNQFKVKRPNILQTNFYGQNVFDDHYTVLRNQLNGAFEGPEQLASFVGLVATNMQNRIEQMRENVARMTMLNFIGGRLALESTNNNQYVIHAITEYNAQTGSALDASNVYNKENFSDFSAWLFARVQDISRMFTERTDLFQTQVTGKAITRHTDKEDQRVYMYSPFLNAIKARVNANVYHDTFLEYADVEEVSFWQSAVTPDSINVTPVYMDTNGEIVKASSAISKTGVIGFIFDRDALGNVIMDEWSDTAKEVAGGFTNLWFHFVQRWWNDFTEKGVVILLD